MTYIPANLRRQVQERARNRCEYCLIPDDFGYMPHEIDHIRAEKHGGETTEDNLCYCCWICNRRKGTDLTSFDPETEEITRLFHPRKERWEDHFQLKGAVVEAITAPGRATLFLLKLNQRERIEERQLLIAAKRYP